VDIPERRRGRRHLYRDNVTASDVDIDFVERRVQLDKLANLRHLKARIQIEPDVDRKIGRNTFGRLESTT
jgi:hypothetical protein